MADCCLSSSLNAASRPCYSCHSPSSFSSSFSLLSSSPSSCAISRWSSPAISPILKPRRPSILSPVLHRQQQQHEDCRPVKCGATVNNRPLSGDQMLVYVPAHPLIKHFVAVLRNELTPPALFRSAMAELGRLLTYEASRDWLVTISGEVQTPCGIASVEFIDPREPVKVVPILRAGLVLAEEVSTVLPATQTYHLGFVRDEETLQPKLYLNKLPDVIAADSRVLITDPMLATGGTIVAAVDELKRRGADPKLIRVIAAVAAPPALEKLSKKFPGLQVYVGIIDETLNDKGFIVPGLGDAGDRSFNT